MKKMKGMSWMLVGLGCLLAVGCGRTSQVNREAERVRARFDSCRQFVTENKMMVYQITDTIEALCRELTETPTELLTEEQRTEQLNYYSLLATCHVIHSDYEGTILSQLEGMEKAQAQGNLDKLALMENGIANIYTSWKVHDEAGIYLERSLQHAEEYGTAATRALVYTSYAAHKTEAGDPEAALPYLQKAQGLLGKLMEEDPQQAAKLTYVISVIGGWIYINLPDSVGQGVEMLKRLYDQYAPYKYVYSGFDIVCYHLALGYERLGRKAEAEHYYDVTADIVARDSLLVRFDTANPLMEHYLARHDNEAVLRLVPAWKKVNDNFYKESTTRQIAIHAVKSKIREKEQQLQLTQKQLHNSHLQNVIYMVCIGVLLLLIVYGILWWRRRRRMLRRLFEMLMQQHLEWMEAHHLLRLSKTKLLVPQPSDDASADEQEEYLHSLYCHLMLVMENEQPFLTPDLSIQELARVVGTNRTHLSNAINRCAGCNFSFWLARYRVNYLIGLLQQNPADGFETLYSRAGFSSRTSFYRQFKQVTGLTPNQFMQQQRGGGKIGVSLLCTDYQ